MAQDPWVCRGRWVGWACMALTTCSTPLFWQISFLFPSDNSRPKMIDALNIQEKGRLTFDGDVADAPAGGREERGGRLPQLQALDDDVKTSLLGNGLPVLVW